MFKTCSFIGVLFLSCDPVEKHTEDTKRKSYLPPQKVLLNLQSGYKKNIVTNRPIDPLLNSKAEMVVSGEWLTIEPMQVEPQLIHFAPAPEVRKIKEISAHPNKYPMPEEKVKYPMSKASLEHFDLDDVDPIEMQRLDARTTFTTGIPFEIKGKTVPCRYPEQTKALPPRFKDAAHFDIQYLDVEQGMKNSYVRSLLLDSRGNIWLGTNGGGVSKYNGLYFTHFTTESGLPDNRVGGILEDRNGNIWFGTHGGGVCMYNGASFTHITEEQGLSNNVVISMLEDEKGNFWFGTEGGGVNKLAGNTLTIYTENEGLPKNIIFAIEEDHEGTIWLGGNSSCTLNNETTTRIKLSDKSPRYTINYIFEDSKHNIWYGTEEQGVIRMDGRDLTIFGTEQGLSHPKVGSISEDYVGTLWFSTEDGGINRFNGEEFLHFTKEEGLSHNKVNEIEKDNCGNLWLGTDGGGVNILRISGFEHYNKKLGLPHDVIYPIIEDRKGNLWMGSEGGGVVRYDGNTFAHYQLHTIELQGNMVRAVFEDSRGNIWFGTYGEGVYKYDGKKFFHLRTSQVKVHNVILSIAEDKSGNIWFGTEAGAYRFDGKNLEQFNLPHDRVRTIYRDSRDHLWFGTWGGGVSRFDGTVFIHYTEKEGLPSNTICDLHEDAKGNIWIATYGGLAKLIPGNQQNEMDSLALYTTDQGLEIDLTYSVLEDADGRIWVGTENGLNCIVKEPAHTGEPEPLVEFEEQTRVLHFGKKDGLKGLDFMVGSALLDSKNRAWWGTGKNLTTLDMNTFRFSDDPPSISLDQLEINDRYYDFRNSPDDFPEKIEFESVRPFQNIPDGLSLPYKYNHLTFTFSAIDWHSPNKIKYSYMVEGLNDDWSSPRSEARAEYRNIPYGDYTFKVRARGQSGTWSETTEYPFIVYPPWWQTNWAKAGYLLAVLMGIFGFVRIRTISLEKRQKELEHEIAVATSDIIKEKKKSEDLLLNILPFETAEELKSKGSAETRLLDQATIMFTDFKDFTTISKQLSPKDLVASINECFSKYDRIVEKYGVEKIKTMGDAYVAAGGLPKPDPTHAYRVVRAAIEIQKFMHDLREEKRRANLPFFEVRIGINSGPVITGIVGIRKFQFDLWGDTVNIAKRMESLGQEGRINISRSTYDLVKDCEEFRFIPRGNVQAKGHASLEMFFVEKV